jgi:hypothetical protein
LIRFWLKGNKPDVFDFDFVLGHDEVACVKQRRDVEKAG